MSQSIIPVSSTDLYYTEIVQLEGKEYLLTFQWSNRLTAWVLNVSDQDQNILAAGIIVKVNFPLLHRFNDSRLPPGILLGIDSSGLDQDPIQPFDLGTRVFLNYISSDDPLITG